MLGYQDDKLIKDAMDKYKEDITAKLESVNKKIRIYNKYIDSYDDNMKIAKKFAVFGPIVGTFLLTIFESFMNNGIVGPEFIFFNATVFVVLSAPIAMHDIKRMKQTKKNIQEEKIPDLTMKQIKYENLLKDIDKLLSNDKKEDSNNNSSNIAQIDRTYENTLSGNYTKKRTK